MSHGLRKCGRRCVFFFIIHPHPHKGGMGGREGRRERVKEGRREGGKEGKDNVPVE